MSRKLVVEGEKEAAGRRLRARESWLGAVLRSIADAVVTVDRECVITFANPVAARLTGVPEERLAGSQLGEVFSLGPAPHADDLLRRVRGAIAGDPPEQAPLGATLPGAGGGATPIECTVTPIAGAAGTPDGAVIVMRDITERLGAQEALLASERKRATEDLKRREAYLRAIMDNSPDRIWLKDTAGVYLDLNAKLVEATGRPSAGEIRGKTDFDLYPEQEARRIRATDEEAIRCGGKLFLEESLGADGRKHFTEKFKSPIKDASGNVIGVCGFSRDITDRRGSEELLRKLSRAVDQSPSTIVITNTEGTIEYVNPRFTELTGYTREEAIGKNPRILNAGKLPMEVYEGLWHTIAAGKEWRGELLNRKKNGDLFWENATIAPVRDDRGTVTHFVAIKEDITKRKEAEAELARRAEDLLQAKSRAEQQAIRLGVQAFELRKAREDALKASKLKSEFVANMSHEIRTPMNGVLGMAGLLLDTSLSDEQREYAEIIRTSGEALLSIVNDILDFSKIEAGKMELEAIDFNIRTTIEESIDLVAASARQKGLELVYGLADGVPASLRGDPGRIRQVLSNLLSNAVKFTERGEVEVSVSAAAVAGGVAPLTVVIRDTGIGIAEDELPRLFKSFSQADGSTTRRHGGTGLGLVIAKQLVEIMGGEIGVRSRKGEGSEFWFTVRLPVQTAATAGADGGSLVGIRALIVDDNETSRKILMRQLTSWRMRPAEAASGREALALLSGGAKARDPFAVAILDMQMPEMDGIALARAILADPACAATRLLMLTSSGPESVRDAIGLGVRFCFPKPVKEGTLKNAVEQLFVPPAVPAGGAEDAGAGRGNPRQRRLRRVLVAEDNPVNQRVALRMLEKLGCRADVVANGREALHALGRLPYDLVLMDCQMPVMDGFEATARIRKLDGRGGKTLVVAMTANALRGDRERCMEAGMDDYLSKPVTQEALESLLAKWDLVLAAAGGAEEECAPAPDEGLDPEKVAELRELGGDDNPEWLQTLVQHFLRDTSGRLVTLRAAFERRDARELEEVAHALKGSCATLGVTPMRAIAERLQAMGRAGAIGEAAPLIAGLERELVAAGRRLESVLIRKEEGS